MPELVPFRGLRYDPRAVAELSTVLCPPYDVISVDDRARLAASDRRNAVHVELPSVDGGRSPYDRAAETFHGWLADGTLVRDERPLIYVYEHEYALPGGQSAAARGFFCRVGLEDFEPDAGIRAHEATLAAPKEDRFRLMSAVHANLSPVLFVYETDDRGERTRGLIEELSAGPPDVQARGPYGEANRLWLADPETAGAARELLRVAGGHPLTIADGHHRYETALRFRDTFGVPPDARFVLGLVYEAHSGGLALLPWHRMLRGVAGQDLLAAASSWFSVEPVDSADRLLAVVGSSPDPGVLGLWNGGAGAILRVDGARVDQLLPDSTSETLRWLDVTVLSATLTRMLGVDSPQLAGAGRLTYVADASAAVAAVESGAADACFLLRPTPIEAVIAVAAAGEHMPAKSTYFQPKAATGLVFNPLY